LIRSYASALAVNYLNQFLAVLVNLVLIPYLLHRLGPRQTGVYLVLMTVANFMAVGIGWLAGAGVRSIAAMSPADGNAQVARVHRVVVLGFAIYSTAVLAVIVGASRLAGTWWLQDTVPEALGQVRLACVLLGVYIWITYVHNADLALLTALLRQGEANLYRVLAQVLFGSTALVLLIHHPQIDVLMAAQVVAVLITAVFVRIRLRRRGVIGPCEWSWPDRALMRQILVTTGASYFLFGLAQFVLMYADVFVVGAVLGSEAVTAYVVVWRMAEFAGLLLSRISETLSPYLTRLESLGDSADLRTVFLTTSRFQHWLAIAAGSGYAIVGPWIVGMWIGTPSRPSTWWFYLLAGAALAFQVVNRHDVILHFAAGCVGRLVIPHVLEVGTKLALTVALFPALGIGAPLAAFVAVQTLGMTWWYRRAGLQLVSASWAEWRQHVGRPVGLELIPFAVAVIVVGPHAMTWSWPEALGASTILSGLLTLVFWQERRRQSGASFTMVAGLLSKY
jgi:O-antigen/teichoic acid export membrane protein